MHVRVCTCKCQQLYEDLERFFVCSMPWNIIRRHQKASSSNLLSQKRWWEICFLVASDGIHKYSNCGQRCLTVTNHDLVILTMSDHYWSQLTTKWKTSLRIAAFISFIVFSSGRNFIFSLVGSIRSKRFKPLKPFETFEYSSIIWVVLVFLNFLVRGRSLVGQWFPGSLITWQEMLHVVFRLENVLEALSA